MEGSDHFKFMSLDMERLKCEAISKRNLEDSFKDIIIGFTRKEFETYLMNDQIDYVMGRFSSFIEKLLASSEINKGGVVYVQTSQMLKFYKHYFQNNRKDLVFISDSTTNLEKISASL